MTTPLRMGAQVVLQYPDPRGKLACRPLAGLPAVTASQIVVLPFEAYALPEARAVGRALERSLLAMAPGAHTVRLPCPSASALPLACHAFGRPGVSALLVLVGAGGPPSHGTLTGRAPSWPALLPRWQTGGGGRRVLPLLADPSLHPSASGAGSLPIALGRANVRFWRQSPVEAVPEILAAAGVIPEDWRLFISYRRRSGAALADQLFDALSRARFDVFLDRFQIPPSVDFVARLEDELRDKAAVLVLESADILTSNWTRFEVAYARRYRLGLFALRMPGGRAVPGVGRDRRLPVSAGDFTGASGALTLAPGALQRCVDWIRQAHARAVLRRRAYLRETVRDALLLAGGLPSAPSPDGTIRCVTSPGASATTYALRVSPHPPRTRDFRHADTLRPPGERSVIVGPMTFRDIERADDIDWLARRGDVVAVEEGTIYVAARALAAGAL